MTRFHLITYVSRASGALSEQTLEHLGVEVRSRNAALGVTGLLLYDGVGFMQSLEGDRAAVANIMQAIARDIRHRDITYVTDRGTTCRQFGCSMRVRHAHRRVPALGFLQDVKSDLAEVQDADLRAHFIGFAALAMSRMVGRHEQFA